MEITNETLKTQLNHRSIRAFEKEPLAKEQLTAIYEAARHPRLANFCNSSVFCGSQMK